MSWSFKRKSVGLSQIFICEYYNFPYKGVNTICDKHLVKVHTSSSQNTYENITLVPILNFAEEMYTPFNMKNPICSYKSLDNN